MLQTLPHVEGPKIPFGEAVLVACEDPLSYHDELSTPLPSKARQCWNAMHDNSHFERRVKGSIETTVDRKSKYV
jgi:hypothetical protein